MTPPALSTVRDQAWAWSRTGTGDADVILVHGWQNDAGAWGPLVAGLDPSRCRLTLVDLPGCGASPAPGHWSRATIEELARDLAALMETWEMASAVVVGHSLGGAIALELALARPELTGGLVLFAPASTSGLDFVDDEQFAMLLDPTTEQRRALLRAAFHRAPPDDDLAAMEATVARADPVHVEGAARSMRTFRVQDRLRAIRCPTLVIAGDRDRHVPLRNHLATWQHLRRAGLHVMHDVGHVPFWEDAPTSQTLVTRFLDDEVPARFDR